MKTVAITGAGGFIGQRIAEAALAAGWRVRALSRSPEKLPAEFAPLRWDMEDGITPDLLKGVDAVIHSAAYRPDDLDDPAQADRCMRINAGGTLALLAAARDADAFRFIYLSAGNAYNSPQSPIPETAQLFPARRAAYYLSSKLMGEIYVSHWDQTGQISGCILRISSVYGPGMDERGLIAATARKLVAGQAVSLRNGGSFGADMVYVDDVARAAVTALDVPFHGAVNVGSGEVSTARDIAQALAAVLDADENLIRLELAAAAPEASFGALDITLARRELGYVPTPLREGLARTWDSIREKQS
jgi:UDP-glucose 4-epimerase